MEHLKVSAINEVTTPFASEAKYSEIILDKKLNENSHLLDLPQNLWQIQGNVFKTITLASCVAHETNGHILICGVMYQKLVKAKLTVYKERPVWRSRVHEHHANSCHGGSPVAVTTTCTVGE